MVLLACSMALLLGGCGKSGGGGADESLADLGIDDGASKGESKSALVKAGAESSIKLKTGARLDIPEGAVDDDVEIAMKRPRDEVAAPLVKMVRNDYKAVSAPYVVTPHGKAFNKDLELTLPVAKGNPDKLVVAWLEDEDDTTWEIHSKPKVTGKEASFPVKHFSVYVLLERVDDEAPDAASEQPDAGSPGLDAGVATRDAGTDASVRPDAATSGSFQQRLTARFAECSLVKQSGTYADTWAPTSEMERCAVECLLDAACVDLEAAFCASANESAAYLTCVTRCFSYSIVECMTAAGQLVVPSCDGFGQCLDGSDEANCPPDAYFACGDVDGTKLPKAARCDGEPHCDNGADEANCPPGTQFVCDSGEIVPAHAQCDDFTNCADSSDETHCEKFSCLDGAQQVPKKLVCNLMRDCSDGSDEDQGCLALTCDVDSSAQGATPFGATAKSRKSRQ
jgi:hypothetical protein